MRTQERDRRAQQTTLVPQPAGAGAPGEPAEELAQRARSLLDLGDALIRRALSGDSQRFLAQNRQHGGE
jgi:hypothetical protein